MRTIGFVILAAASLAVATPTLDKRAAPSGIDVSHFQGAVDFNTAKANGIVFTYIKATEGTTFIDPEFNTNFVAATNAGLIRGGYLFAHPDISSGATQADFFLAHGGTYAFRLPSSAC
ncbi:hypothetical protein EUX98_g8540 [Antrodiella citrinella]|uniref:Lysozyme n=1 Tax=Antrodiella citrinella TaxID=2447956 RepID=A0A4S4M5X7_9APHY|nr:hypothetical protein EUX98_g8540 [Antrodiella citrinella]